MAHEPGDPRVRRTHKLLQDALIDLTAERGFDAITVGDIAQRATVNRATFYRHYQDKYDLLEQIFREAMIQFIGELGPPGTVALATDPQNPPERWVRFFAHFAEHERLYTPLLGQKGSAWFVARMRDQFVAMLDEREQRRARLAAARGKKLSGKMPRQVALTLASNLLMSTLAWWLESGRPYSPAQMASWFLDIAINGYVRALGL